MFNLLKKQLTETKDILLSFKGNARAVLITEPLWGIPYNLYATYTSLYMIALGCSNTQVGLIASVNLLFQVFFSLIGGYVTDKLGRKKTTLIFDLISWSIPTLIWAFAQNFYYFLIAAVINSIVRIVHTSWSCLMIEGTRPSQRVHIFTWIQVAGLLAGFFAPLAGFLVEKYTIIPAMRGLYLFAFVSMTAMFLIRNHITHETEMGKLKIEETRNYKLRDDLIEYKKVASQLITNPYIMTAFFLVVLKNIQITIKRTFFAILLNKGLGLSTELIAIFPAVNSAIMLIFFLTVMPTLGKYRPKKPLLWGAIVSILSHLLLVMAPEGQFITVMIMVTLSTILEAVGFGILHPFVESILANAIPDHNRAKIMSLLYALLMATSAPFGYIGGVLSSMSEKLPFVLTITTFIISIILVILLNHLEENDEQKVSLI